MKLIDAFKDMLEMNDEYDEDDEESYLSDMARLERKNKERERKAKSLSSSGSDDKITSIFSKRAGASTRGTSSKSKGTSRSVRSNSNSSQARSARTSGVQKTGSSQTAAAVASSKPSRSNTRNTGTSEGTRQFKTRSAYSRDNTRDNQSFYDNVKKDEISIFKVANFEDATLVCDKLTSGLPIIVSFDNPANSQSQRIMDFIAGCIYTINGSLHTISDKIFLFSPEGVDVSGDYINMVKENSFGVPTFNKMI